MLIVITLFLIISFGLGSVSFFAGWDEESFSEKLLINLALGIAAIPVLGVLFNVLQVPIDHRYFLLLASLSAIAGIYFSRKNFLPDISVFEEIDFRDLLLIFLFGLSLFMYLKGSFSYSWFESSDPWLFASATKLIEIERTYTAPIRFSVSQPYPQGMQIFIAIFNQINGAMNENMKFFFSFLPAFSLVPFYFLAKKVFSSKTTALVSTFILASQPAWMTHYIFTLNFAVIQVPLLLYTLKRAEKNKNWAWLSAMVFACVWLTHFYSAFVISLLFFIWYLARLLSTNSLSKPYIKAALGGFAFSLLFWIPSLRRFPSRPGGMGHVERAAKFLFSHPAGLAIALIILISGLILYFTSDKWTQPVKNIFSSPEGNTIKLVLVSVALASIMAVLLYPRQFMDVLGSGSMEHDFGHFFLLRYQPNLIQNPFGAGPLVTILAIAGFIFALTKLRGFFSPERFDRVWIMFFTIFTFLGVMSARFSINLMPFRMWHYFALSISLLSADFLKNAVFTKISKNKHLILQVVIILALAPTFYIHKYRLNSRPWNENYVGMQDGRDTWEWVRDNLPRGSTVYAFGISQNIPIVYNMLSYKWDEEVRDYPVNDIFDDPQNNYQFFKEKSYEYVVIDKSTLLFRKYVRTLEEGEDETALQQEVMGMVGLAQRKIEIFSESEMFFEEIKRFPSGAIFKIK